MRFSRILPLSRGQVPREARGLFSRCKLNMTTVRKKMDPDSLDMLMFLKANKELWPDARTVQHLLDSLTPDDWANADVEDEEEEASEG